MYKAIVFFKDMKDNLFAYKPGDTFPRKGLKVDDKRIEELSTCNNRRGKPVIELVKEEPKKKAEAETKAEAEMKEEPKQEKTDEVKPKKRGRKKNAD